MQMFKEVETKERRLETHVNLEFFCVTPQPEPVQANIGFVSKSYLKVGCVNLPANGLAKASLLF